LYSNNIWLRSWIHDLLTIARKMSGVVGVSGSIVPDSEPAEVTLPSAEIIPFPVRAQHAETQPADRLAQALESLNAAMAEQKAALATWRAALAALQASTSGLGESLQRYQTSLGTLSGNVDALRESAVSLEQWADGVRAQ
jgi:septal ring factor EnvC (AmiA/AmiB activator)